MRSKLLLCESMKVVLWMDEQGIEMQEMSGVSRKAMRAKASEKEREEDNFSWSDFTLHASKNEAFCHPKRRS
jgi:hypothetical protein